MSMSRGGIKRGKDNIYEAVKAQYCDPTDEERLALKTPQTCCIHCNVGQTRNTSEMHWHLCICQAFGAKESALQNMLRFCVPESLMRSQKKKNLVQTWHRSATSNEDHSRESNTKAQENPVAKKRKVYEAKPHSNDESFGAAFNKLVAKWVYMYQIPATAVEAPEFLDIIKLLNPDINKLPDRNMLSKNMIEVLYHHTCSQVSEHFEKCESLQLQLPVEHDNLSGSSQHEKLPTSAQLYDGRGAFFYVPYHGTSSSTAVQVSQVIEAVKPWADQSDISVVSLKNTGENYTETSATRAISLLQSCENQYPHKIYVPSQPFSALGCAELMVSSIPAFNQAVAHAQGLVQYFQSPSAPAVILRNITDLMRPELSGAAANIVEQFKIPETSTVQSMCDMLVVVSTAQQAGIFNRLLADNMYQNYCRSLTDSRIAQASISVQSILLSEAAMTGIEQAAFTMQLLVTAAAKTARPYCATYSDALAARDALIGAVNKTSRLSHPWKTMIMQVIAARWEKSYHMIVALACKMDPRRKFSDLPGTMEADAQRMRDKLIAHADPTARKAVIDSWVLLMKREDAFGSAFALENAHIQSPKDWWLAHTAAHKHLRELVAFPALSALGVPLPGNSGASGCDPHSAARANAADVAMTVHAAELSPDILNAPDLIEKLAYIRRNGWSLHHARTNATNIVKLASNLLAPADLEIYDYSNQHQVATSSSARPAETYSPINSFEFTHSSAVDGGTSSSSSSSSSQAQQNVVNRGANLAFITLHPNGSPSQQVLGGADQDLHDAMGDEHY